MSYLSTVLRVRAYARKIDKSYTVDKVASYTTYTAKF